MLQSLTISNFVIIEKAYFEFGKEFNVFSGETGSGKSLLFNAILFVMGKRFNPLPVGPFKDTSFVELLLCINDQDLRIRREVFSNGRSILSINDKQCSLKSVKSLLQDHIEVVEQNDIPSYSSLYLIDCIDTYAAIDTESYQNEYSKLIKLKKSLLELQKQHQRHQNLELRLSDLKELNELKPCLKEYQKIENSLKHMDRKVNHKDTLHKLNQILKDRSFRSSISSLESLSGTLDHQDLSKNITQIIILLEYINEEITDDIMRLEDTDHLETLESRLKEYQPYIKRYGSLDDLCKYYKNLLSYEENHTDFKNDLENLKLRISNQQVHLKEIASQLSIQRMNAIPDLIDELIIVLNEMKLDNIDIQIQHSNSALNHSGVDTFKLEVNLNQQDSLFDFKETASGGEKSRFHLALILALAKQKKTKVYLFDEIDTGVSGLISGTMGKVFKTLSKSAQVLVITHQAPIAAYANTHFSIEKKRSHKKVVSSSVYLKEKQRIKTLALMMSGNQSLESCEVAKQLLEKGAL